MGALLLTAAAVQAPRASAAPAEIQILAPVAVLPANYLLATDPEHATLEVQVSANIRRNQFCPAGDLLLPCPAQNTPVRITVGLGLPASRPATTVSETVNVLVGGVADFDVTESLELDPVGLLADLMEYEVTVTIEHVDDLATGIYTRDVTRTFGPYRLADFTGEIQFGPVAATLGELTANPVYLGDSRWSLRVASAESEHGHELAHTVQAPPPLVTQRNSRGGLSVVSGAVEVLGPKAFDGSAWEGERGLTLLTTNGYVARAITLELPPGVGWRSGNERRLRPEFTTAGVDIPLDEDLNPTGTASGQAALPMHFVSETYPVEFTSEQWRWDRGVLELVGPATRFLRQEHFQDWQDAGGDIPESNDGFWFLLDPKAASNLGIRPGLAGGITADVTFRDGEFFSHFPLAGLGVPEGGSLRITNNLVAPDLSGFSNARVHVLYGKGCRDPLAPGDIPEPQQAVEVNEVELGFTPSAGLWAEGTLTTTTQNPAVERHLEIGRNGTQATHRTDPFTTFRFYMPGAWVPHADGFDSPVDAGAVVDNPGEDPLAFNPARYLLSGVRPAEGFALEHPETTAYAAGAGDYAGANFRHFNGLQARSHVGGVDVAPYPLTPWAKYYARVSGVSGIHESATGPEELPAYGYDMSLTRFGLSFLSNEPHDSRIEGAIDLPVPVGFAQQFERLMLSCCGNLEDGRIDPEDTDKQLAYWSGTRLSMQSLRFTHDPNAPCDTEDALLELGVVADVGHLSEEPGGFLYPRPNGTLVATDDLGRESHLALAALVDLAGYPFVAVRRAYFNDNAPFPSGPGWINLAGLAGVSFFRDLPVHAHVLGSKTEPPPPLFMKGGWTDGSDTYFNRAGFDAAHRGFAPGVNAGEYQTGDTHLPRAEQVWFGTVDFEYPVRFDGLTRSFASPAPKGVDLVVLDVESELQRLNAELADLRFSAFLNLSLLAAPEFLVEEGVSWVTGQMEEAAVEALARGLSELADLLDAQMRRTLDTVVLPAVEGVVVNPLVAALPADGNAVGIGNALDQYLDTPFTQALQGLAETAGAATNLIGQITGTLESATQTLETVRNVLLQLQQAEQLIVAGLEAVGVDIDLLPADLQAEALAELEASLGELESDGGPGVGVVGRLMEIREAIQELEQAVGTVIDAMDQGQAFLVQLQDTVVTPVAQYAQMGTEIKERLENWLNAGFALEPGAYAAEELRARVRQEIRDVFASAPVAAHLQTVIRSWVYNTDAAVRQALDTAFQSINDQIVAVALVALDEIIQAAQPVKTFSSVVESVNWDGRAHIRGDRLTLLRLDHGAIVNVPTPLPGVQVPVEFTGFYEFRELTSDGPVGCLGGVPARTHEILMGSSAGPASIFGGGNRLTVTTKFTRTEAGALLQMAGALVMEQQGPELQMMGLQEFSSTLSISPGAGEFYLSAFARGYANLPGPSGVGPTELAGGALFGRTCTFETFAWDPDAEEVLGGPVDGDNAFTGAYLFGEATIPLFSVGCVLSGSIGAGARVFVNDPDYDFAGLTVGGRLEGSVSAEFLCLAKLKGSAFMQGTRPEGQPFRFDGGAEMSGKIGICPFCVKFGGEIQASYVHGSGWDVRY